MSAPLREADKKLIGEGLGLLLDEAHNLIVTCPDPENHKETLDALKQKYLDTVILMTSMRFRGTYLSEDEIDRASDYRRELKT